MDFLTGWIQRIRLGARLDELADQIAPRCFDSVWNATHETLPTLTAHEQRGYIRARGALTITQQVAAALQDMVGVESRRPQLVTLVDARVQNEMLHRLQLRSNQDLRRAA